jgi:hypothetical protein
VSSTSARDRMHGAWKRLPHPLRWVAVAAVGGTLVVVGLVLMVLPGPGIPLLILGLVVLASEFAWAQRTLHRVQRHSRAALTSVSSRFTRREQQS